ncbi:MAG: ATP-grasp domain-containing protein [Armatimonadota bacterium]
MRNEKPILVLDGHTNHALACVRSLGRAGFPMLVASTRWRPLAAWSRYCRDAFLLSGETVQSFSALRFWARGWGAQIVLPLTERACVLCNLERDAWEAAGIRVGCGPPEMLQRAFDKALTFEAAAQCEVRAPLTVAPTSLAEAHAAVEQLGFPCVVKPRFSHAWDGAAFAPNRSCAYPSSREQLEAAVLSRVQGECWPLLQQYVPGDGKGVFALCDQGRVVAWFAHQRLRDTRPTGSGSSLRRSIVLDPRLREPAQRLLSALSWHGPAMVEFRDDGVQPPCLMEVNGRFWTSLQLAVDSGVDFPAQWVAVLRGESPGEPAAYEDGVILRWLWGDMKRLLCILTGPPAGFTGPYPTRIEGFREIFGRQPAGTRLEMWRRDDPWPALGEWLEGLRDLVDQPRKTHRPGEHSASQRSGSHRLPISDRKPEA